MAESSNIHVEQARIQQEIEKALGLAASNLVFDYQDFEGQVKLDMVTVNPVHQQSFLFHTVLGDDKVDAIRIMLDYVQNYREIEDSYTIQWCLKSEDDLHTSYFRANNIIAAIEKLYYGKDPKSIVVFSANLNPIS